MYVLDANVLIDANRDYYPIERVPEFWRWLVHKGTSGEVRIPLETFEELDVGKPDALTEWAVKKEVRRALLLEEEANPALVSRVVAEGYAPDLTDEEVLELGKDPFLISYGIADPDQRIVVTTENRKPTQKRARRRIPDVCDSLGIRCVHTYEMLRELDFRTDWESEMES